MTALPHLGDKQILELRSAKNPLNPLQPYAWMSEPEFSAEGRVDPVNTIFLTNRECPYRCLMCDLWKNTLDERVPEGAIPKQIEFALQRLPAARVIKLYNSGNFFDNQAVPAVDLPAIAALLSDYETVIVENHPNLRLEASLSFRDMLSGELEVAMGLETIHPQILPRLNKRMSLDDFRQAACFLIKNGIHVRSFVLLRPPGLSEGEGVEWAVKSTAFAFEQGVRCCAIVPTRAGNGALDGLLETNHFAPPTLEAIEATLDRCLLDIPDAASNRVFMDVWDLERFSKCPTCLPARLSRIQQINLTQKVSPRVDCSCQTF